MSSTFLTFDFIGLFILIAGFILGLGAVTVIDLHGFLGRKSQYWTEATTRTHKVTKPLIWAGIALVLIGGILFHKNFSGLEFLHFVLVFVLILNGVFLTFRVSPFLLKREKEGKSSELLPNSWQNKITLGFIVSFLGWWGLVLLNCFLIVERFS